MTDHEPPNSDSGPHDEHLPPPGDQRPRPPTATHSRPLPSPPPDRRRFATPTQPPLAPPKREPTPAPKPRPDPDTGRVAFPVAKPPPGLPSDAEPPDVPIPTPFHPRPVARKATPPVADAEADAGLSRPATRPAVERITAPAPEPKPDTDEAPAVQPEPDATTAPATMRRGSLYGYVVYLALAIGTFPLPGDLRFVLLWTLLIGLGGLFLFFDEQRPPGPIDPLNFSWGAGVGFVLGLPVMLMASRALGRTAAALIPIEGLPSLLQVTVLTWPLGETLFYRGAVQREHGLVPAALTAALGSALLYWPETEGVFAVLFVAVTFATALAFIYGYVRRRYGLAAAFACQLMTNVLLIFIPRLLTTPPA